MAPNTVLTNYGFVPHQHQNSPLRGLDPRLKRTNLQWGRHLTLRVLLSIAVFCKIVFEAVQQIYFAPAIIFAPLRLSSKYYLRGPSCAEGISMRNFVAKSFCASPRLRGTIE